MHFHIDQTTLSVSPTSPLTVNDAAGRSLRVIHGRIWITQQGSLDDVFLDAGESYAFDGTGAAVVTAENADRSSSTLAFDTPLTVRASATVDRNWFSQLKQSWGAGATA